MAFPYPTRNSRLRASATEGGTYSVVGRVTSITLDGGTEGGGRDFYFGGEIVSSGDAILSGSAEFIRDRDDANGQERIRDGWLSGDSVWFQYGVEGVDAYDDVEQFEAKITAFTESTRRGDRWATGSFSFEAVVSTLETVTLA